MRPVPDLKTTFIALIATIVNTLLPSVVYSIDKQYY